MIQESQVWENSKLYDNDRVCIYNVCLLYFGCSLTFVIELDKLFRIITAEKNLEPSDPQVHDIPMVFHTGNTAKQSLPI